MKLIFLKSIKDIHSFLDVSTTLVFNMKNIKISEQNERKCIKEIGAFNKFKDISILFLKKRLKCKEQIQLCNSLHINY